MNLKIFAKTHFLNKVTFTGSKDEGVNTSFGRTQFHPRQKKEKNNNLQGFGLCSL